MIQASKLFAVLALLAAPSISLAATGTHAVRGVVKSITQTLLVITRSTQHPSDLAFVINSSTLRTGTIAVGAEVSVRYRIEGQTLVAAAVVANRRPHTPGNAF